MHIHTQRDRNTHTHRQPDISRQDTEAHTYTETGRQTDRHTHTDVDTDRQTVRRD